MAKSDRQKLVERAQKLVAADPVKAAAWRGAWVAALAKLEPFLHARAKCRPAMKVYERHRFVETARAAMLQALMDGKTVEEAEAAALAAIRGGP